MNKEEITSWVKVLVIIFGGIFIMILLIAWMLWLADIFIFSQFNL